MEIRQLEWFVTVADLGSFTKAAWLLQVPQPALSRQVRALEIELRQTLFHRNGRGVSLSEAGKRFLSHCRGILVQIERARTELDNSRDEPSGEVALGFPHSIARLITIPTVFEFRRQFPLGSLRVTEGLTFHLQEWLLAGRLDIALLHDPVPTPMLETLPLHEQNLYVVGSSRTKTPLPPTIELARLAELPLVLQGRPHPMRMLLETRLANIGCKLRIVQEIDAIAGIVDLVEADLGFAVVSINAIPKGAAKRFTSHKIVSPELKSVLVLAHSAERPLTSIARKTMLMLRQQLAISLARSSAEAAMQMTDSS
ncbi:LysR family transcriptional regulator [Variovorax ginsengisoli]|uniref:LysR family transcriptional regulator n=1 Tax=Variovorax ginsengisoli TaxID=363844 RepID=A0ABT8SEM0_9BURK|nr:LysR family transcriptional regulator [Variovorax ginsengisoli]MDN8618203.1 LysR family transcriptional regulator [Variovorax ginsengisoli]MDO1537373.1 LysR family transcriptional regulator [Variovorax ginsengisoli]